MRLRPGIMRNEFYPKSIAEYLPLQRFAELGLTKADIGVRDTQYGVLKKYQQEVIDDAVEHVASGGGDSYAPGVGLPEGSSMPEIEAPDTAAAMEVERVAVGPPASLLLFVVGLNRSRSPGAQLG